MSFFSVGFLAGSFEQAAGLGSVEHGARPTYAVELAALPSAMAVPALDPPPAPVPPVSIAPAPRSVPPLVPMTPVQSGDAKATETVAIMSPRPKASLASLAPAPEAAPDARKLRPFFEPAPPGPDAFPVVPEPAQRPQEFVLPIEKGRVTSMFNQGRYHPAIDLAAPLGTQVYATTRKQRVTFAGWRGGYGNLVITRDPQGRQHYYGHLHRIIARIGAVLEQGQTLGLLGTTGHSTGPHVHYEVRTPQGRQVDPSKLLFAGRRVSRGYAWNIPRPSLGSTRLAAGGAQPRPR